MLEAAFWGAVAGSSLVLGALIAMLFHPPSKVVGVVMAFGAGTLISAVAYELIGDSIEADDQLAAAVGLLLGACVFFAGDWFLSRNGAHSRKRLGPADQAIADDDSESGVSIVLGTVLDGIPESFVMGLSLLEGGGSAVGLIVAVFISNLPEAIGGTSSLSRTGWTSSRILFMWCGIAAVSALSTVLGYAYFDSAPTVSGARVEAFAAGAIIAMLSTTMVPEAHRLSGRIVGVITTIGFAVGVALSGA